MAGNLERRTRAIADALRAAMRDPTPTRAVAPPHLPSLRESLSAQIDWDEAEPVEGEDSDTVGADEEVTSPPIPPLETAAAMSSTASMALFGHT